MPSESERWRAHPVLGALVRILVVLIPLAVSILVSLAVIAVLPSTSSLAGKALWWTIVLALAWGAALLVERVARRALPLAVLLELSLVFPDRAPSRLRAMRGTTVRELENQLAGLRAKGAQGTPLEVAETLVSLVGSLGLHDPRTRGHSERVRAYVDLISDELQLPEHDRLRLRWAALIHDLGKLTVPAGVLNGGKDLPPDAWTSLKRHPEEGKRLAAGLLPWLGEWAETVHQHHEWWDGAGYPRGLAGEEICRGARIVAVADSFEVMTTNRSYAKARSAAAAREELSRCAGTQFDPAVVRAFLHISIGKLRGVLGPLAGLSVVPFAAGRAGDILRAGVGTAVVAGAVVVGVIPGPGSSSPPPIVSSGSDSSTTVTGSTATPLPAASASAAGTRPPASTAPTSRPPVAPPAPAGSAIGAPAAARAQPYYLVPNSLSPRRPTGEPPATVQLLPDGASRSFDLVVGAASITLPDAPLVGLYSRVVGPKGKGNGLGQLTITLSDCAGASGPCREISSTAVPVGTGRDSGGYDERAATLSGSARVLTSGHVLRMTIAMRTQGNALSVELAFGAASTPSRLEFRPQ